MGGGITDGTASFALKQITNKEYTDNQYYPKSGGYINGPIETNLHCMVGGSLELGTGINLKTALDKCRFTNGCNGSLSTDGSDETKIPGTWYNFLYIPHRCGGDGYGGPSGDNHNYGNMLLFPMVSDSSTFYRVTYSNNSIWVYSYG